MATLDTLVSVLKGAGEDTRLRILALLADGEHTVKDLTEILCQSQPRVSRHLKLLADAGLIERHAEGAWAYFGLIRSGAGSELAHWLVERLDGDDPARRADRERQSIVREAQQLQAAEYFAGVAQSWDFLRSLHVPESAVEREILSVLEGRMLDFVVDLGTGTGRMLELLAPHYRHGLGIDSSREMLSVARAKLGAAGVSHAQVRMGDLMQMDDFAAQSDLVILHQVLHYFDNPGQAVAAARQMLKPAGEMLIVDFAPHELEFLRVEHAHRRLGLSPEQVQLWAERAGLRVASLKEFPNINVEGHAGLTVCLWRLAESQQES
ncbi:ArsR family transcriptional regulator [Devosia pacifica]|uniref:ArsR family transcriptional regulator n=1 Tax=Devosia pacifica TaxID=1335967 RepID=A0A918VQN8_9HYPH|nr:metalloregulator ArsR/SmtB family transcription factor [Devosia pacifica]GHA15959.1 ArsR family transcriptional regulator [Devosia pacifica]